MYHQDPASEYHSSIPHQSLSEETMICQQNRNIEQTLRFLKDFSAYEEIVTQDFLIHGPATGQETRGIEAAKQLDMGYAIAYPDTQFQINDLIAAGDKVVVRWSSLGTHLGKREKLRISGGSIDLDPSNQKVFINGIHIYRFNQEGKIAESWAMWDRLGEIEQIAEISIVGKK